jgi:hypothetical protein
MDGQQHKQQVMLKQWYLQPNRQINSSLKQNKKRTQEEIVSAL